MLSQLYDLRISYLQVLFVKSDDIPENEDHSAFLPCLFQDITDNYPTISHSVPHNCQNWKSSIKYITTTTTNFSPLFTVVMMVIWPCIVTEKNLKWRQHTSAAKHILFKWLTYVCRKKWRVGKYMFIYYFFDFEITADLVTH